MSSNELLTVFLVIPAIALQFEFPFKLHQLLEDASREGNENIVSWNTDGKGFKIHSKGEFEMQISRRYFSSLAGPKFRSFQRQLAIYGFKRKKDPSFPDCGAYCHPLFIRGQPGLCTGMVRKKIKEKSGVREMVSHSLMEYRGNESLSSDHTKRISASSSPGSSCTQHKKEDKNIFFDLGSITIPESDQPTTDSIQPNTDRSLPSNQLYLNQEKDLLQFAYAANDFLSMSLEQKRKEIGRRGQSQNFKGRTCQQLEVTDKQTENVDMVSPSPFSGSSANHISVRFRDMSGDYDVDTVSPSPFSGSSANRIATRSRDMSGEKPIAIAGAMNTFASLADTVPVGLNRREDKLSLDRIGIANCIQRLYVEKRESSCDENKKESSPTHPK